MSSAFCNSYGGPEYSTILQEFAVTTVKKDEKVEAALKAAYKTKKYGLTGTFGSAGLVKSPYALILHSHGVSREL